MRAYIQRENIQRENEKKVCSHVYTSLNYNYSLCRNHFGETPVDSAFKSGKKELIVLLDKERLLPSADDSKLPSHIMEVRKFTQHI